MDGDITVLHGSGPGNKMNIDSALRLIDGEISNLCAELKCKPCLNGIVGEKKKKEKEKKKAGIKQGNTAHALCLGTPSGPLTLTH